MERKARELQRVFTVVLLLLLTSVLLLAACSNGNNSSSSENENAGNESKPQASEEGGSATKEEPPIEIVWKSTDPPERDDTWTQQYLEKKFNIKITNIKHDNNSSREQTNLLAASKQMPDLIFGGYDYEGLAKQGALAEIPVELIREKMPKYSASVDNFAPSIWNLYKVDGVNYGIPRYNMLAGTKPIVQIYRHDWLKAIGYEKAPTTLAELEDVMYKFRNNDPDGDGNKDTYGMTARAGDYPNIAFSNVFGAFNVQPYQWKKDKDGKLVYGLVTEEARQAFKVLSKWYKDDLLDPEFATNKGSDQTDRWLNQVTGMNFTQWDYAAPDRIVTDRLQLQNPEVELTPGGPVTGPDGTGSDFAFGFKGTAVALGVQVMQDEKKLHKILEILEALATDQETYLATFFGQEGIQYEMVDGVATPIGEWVDIELRSNKAGAGEFFNMFGRNSEVMKPIYFSKTLQEFEQTFMKDFVAMNDEVTFTIPALEKYPDLKRLQDEYFIKLIIGEVDTDKGFDDFVALWKKSGGDEVTASANEVYMSLHGN